jgi:hypothetical protein
LLTRASTARWQADYVIVLRHHISQSIERMTFSLSFELRSIEASYFIPSLAISNIDETTIEPMEK